MARQSLSLNLAERPSGDIVPGRTFKQETTPAPSAADLNEGQILIEALYLSLDPGMRGWLNEADSYLPTVKLGETMPGFVIARVLASKSTQAQPGDIVTAMTGWCEVAIANEGSFEKLAAPLHPNAKVTDLLGVLGLTGLTAYLGMHEIGRPKAGETVVISGAAGATGSVAGQIAKIMGAKRVVGIAGSDEKCTWLKKDLGFDDALNYKDSEFERKLAEATPDDIDVFWDNVGGDILDAALARANKFARFVMCGSISQYNTSKPQGPKNITNIITHRIRMEGFVVFDYQPKFEHARNKLAQLLAEGAIKREVTIVKGGLRSAEQALLDMFHGMNTGKLLVEIKHPGEAFAS
ncbi:hypothetical protein BDV38DRAFT_249120 [Aspergillus pseudotamarii]|uniref:Enoyl reductase (ER) domain-containing protein n=1 Tax=Aspergillus pseudotamarii TaxID=132259 RepID=A0A5N6STQ4_ASPPS|nr:uncharacterized protein BDV38DRAFT_249120 [Aspergillus pseudotamarii]KAE8136773.1 hypothetical protein BDV38DRAFT_249120 [Aspergillus pseudotamarii]